MMRVRAALALLVAAGCQGDCENSPDIERMIRQPKAEPFEASSFFDDGSAMRPLVAGTVPRSRPLGRQELTHGLSAGEFTARVPVEVTRARVEQGRERFGVYCAPCHGLLGDGRSQVSENMPLRKPPSLHEPRIRAFPPGRIYAVITHGYGFMRSYAADLSVDERWTAVMYVRALQRSQEAVLAELPPPLQTEAQRWLK
jgi:hypothetical protein